MVGRGIASYASQVQELLYLAALFTSGVEVLLLTLAVLRIIRNIAGMVDSFCYRFWAEAELDYRQAVGEWNVLQAGPLACPACGYCREWPHLTGACCLLPFESALRVGWTLWMSPLFPGGFSADGLGRCRMLLRRAPSDGSARGFGRTGLCWL